MGKRVHKKTFLLAEKRLGVLEEQPGRLLYAAGKEGGAGLLP
ncbi:MULTISPECIES: hypothetical protein [Paenibacillus]|nr:hypothetical protein [Paenibacillus caseinilyticus]MCZ8522306.1 hypothetical protein [Paenibacillus caseinilyticus]